MQLEKRKAFIINFIYIALVIALIYVGLRYVMYAIMPFVIGFTIAYAMRPISQRIIDRFHLPTTLVRVLVLIVFYAIIVVVLVFLGGKIIVLLQDFFKSAPNIYAKQIEPSVFEMVDMLEVWLGQQDSKVYETINSVVNNLSSYIESFIGSASKVVLGMLSGFATSLPSTIISFLVTIVSSFFFAIDYQKIVGFIMRQFPEKTREIILDIRTYLVGSVFKLFFGYAKIMAITFVELSIGLSVIGVNNAIVVAAIISLFDILPVLGTGGIMIPWVLIVLMNGDIPLAIGLAVIYVVITVIRNIIEPKIVGNTVGLHPIVMLMCMFVGAKLLGILGIFILPILVIVLQKLNESGKVKIFNK